MSAAARLAFVAPDRQIHVMDASGGRSRPVTWSKAPGALSRWGGAGGDDATSWPCWSPDGAWIACFQSRGEDGPYVVSAVEADGIEERELFELSGAMPIYAQWSPHGDRLAVLAQEGDELLLETARLDEIGRRTVIDRGVPLFFSWAPDGERLLVHVGRAEGARVLVRHATGRGTVTLFDDPAGSFCTPLFCGSEAVYVAGRGSGSWLAVSGADGEGTRLLGSWPGLLAVVPSPTSPVVALGAASRGEGSPYEGLSLVPLDGGDPTRLTDEPCMAFFWDPRGRYVLYAALDSAAGGLRWRSVEIEGGRTREHGLCHPSRDLLFHLHFFEQFGRSHPLISPDGRTLVYASHATPGRRDTDQGCQILAVDLLASGAEPRVLAEGSYAVFSPRDPAPLPSA